MEIDRQKVLEKLGLAASESKIYLALLELGPCLAGRLSRKTGIHRRNVYDATERLIAKGLISYILKNNRRTFQAVDPERFNDMLDDHRNALQTVLPDLKAKFNAVIPKEGVDFYKGKHGLRTAFEDQIREGKEILVYGASLMTNELMKYYFVWYDKKRITKKIRMRMIYQKSTKTKVEKLKLSDIRFLDDQHIGEVAYNVYGNTVSIIRWSKENPFVVMMKDKLIADAFRKNFELVWKLAK
ncbi:MAG TPA: helix-turn-helix domain-containing protein [Candidatus Nanoarchaeia archaeon]|nr:helix-turn-helix domain-containing protein [Candidatus Nanoarchaeia archaeon]